MGHTSRIIAEEKVTAVFGEWPAFHDAEVQSVAFDRFDAKVSITLTLDAALASVTLRFADCADVRVEDFGLQNVLFALDIVEAQGRLSVELDASIGMEGSFTCSEVEVLDIHPKALS